MYGYGRYVQYPALYSVFCALWPVVCALYCCRCCVQNIPCAPAAADNTQLELAQRAETSASSKMTEFAPGTKRARATPTPLRHHLYRHRPFRLSTCQRTKLERHATVVLLARRAVDRYFPRNRHRVGGQKSRLPKLPTHAYHRQSTSARIVCTSLLFFGVMLALEWPELVHGGIHKASPLPTIELSNAFRLVSLSPRPSLWFACK
ncbi:hypothetical protein GGS24DRAFT_167244 [Hypoxylon argillaceum]|nr:hypothetical protein GGS24DRAFT_167244 [Hypoxylon argillaceum]